jgi:hypothetical protein
MMTQEELDIDAHHLDGDLDQSVVPAFKMLAPEYWNMKSHIIDEGAAIQEENLNIAQKREKVSGDITAKVDQLETSFVELWSIGSGVRLAEDGKRNGNGSVQAPEFPITPIRRKQWSGSLDQSMLNSFLKWCEEQVSLCIQIHSEANMTKACPSRTYKNQC